MIRAGEFAYRPWAARVTGGPLSGAWSSLRGRFGFSPGKAAPVSGPPRLLPPVAVPGSLADLKGPDCGVVELPITLFWSRPDRQFDLDDRYQAIDLYLAVLDRGSVDELGRYLNGQLLVKLWPDLHLTRAKRLPWQARFAELRPATIAA